MGWKYVPDDEEDIDYTPQFEIEVWSGEFRIPGKGAGYLESTWTDKTCPLPWETLEVGDRVNYIFPDDYKRRTFVCDVVDIKSTRFGRSIQLKVLDIIVPEKETRSWIDVMMSYDESEGIEATKPVAETPKKVRKSFWKKLGELFAPVKLND